MDASDFLRLLGSPGAGLSALADAPRTVGLSALAVDPMGDATAALEARRRQQIEGAGYDPDVGLYDRYSAMLGSVLGPTIAERSRAAADAMRRGDMATYQKIATDLSMDFGGFLGSIKPVGGPPYHLRPGVEQPTPNNPRGLPMDETSVRKRAEDMGFMTDAYHGTTADIRDIRRSKTGAMGPGAYLGDAPEVAGAYAGALEFGDIGGNIIPAKLRGRYATNEEWSGLVRQHGWEGAEAAAKRAGFSGVHDGKFEAAYAVFDPSYIRSRFATFDPERADSSDLLASIAPWLAMLGGGAGLSALYLDGEEGGM